jgi:hypothetical protein
MVFTLSKMVSVFLERRIDKHALERARILRRLRLSLRDLFFFHFSLMLDNDALTKIR